MNTFNTKYKSCSTTIDELQYVSQGDTAPNPFKDSVKIVGNIIELNNPTARILHIDSSPLEIADKIIIIVANIAKMLRTFPASKILVR